jgi:hypothetical protein
VYALSPTRRPPLGVMVLGGPDRGPLERLLRGLGCDPIAADWSGPPWPARSRAAVVDLRGPAAPPDDTRGRVFAALDAAGLPAVVLLDRPEDANRVPGGGLRLFVAGGDPAAGLTVAVSLLGAGGEDTPGRGARGRASRSGPGGLLGLAQDARKQLADRGRELEGLLREPLLLPRLEVAGSERGRDRLEAPGGLGEPLPVAHESPPPRPDPIVPRMPFTNAAARSWQ